MKTYTTCKKHRSSKSPPTNDSPYFADDEGSTHQKRQFKEKRQSRQVRRRLCREREWRRKAAYAHVNRQVELWRDIAIKAEVELTESQRREFESSCQTAYWRKRALIDEDDLLEIQHRELYGDPQRFFLSPKLTAISEKTLFAEFQRSDSASPVLPSVEAETPLPNTTAEDLDEPDPNITLVKEGYRRKKRSPRSAEDMFDITAPPPNDLEECQKLLRNANLLLAHLYGIKDTILTQTNDLKNELKEVQDENNQLRLQAALARNARKQSEKALEEMTKNQQKRQVEVGEESITQNADIHPPKRQKQDTQQQTPQPSNAIESANESNTSDQGNSTKGPRAIYHQESLRGQKKLLNLVEDFQYDDSKMVSLSLLCSQEKVLDDLSSGHNQEKKQQNRENLEAFVSQDTQGRWFCLRDVLERGCQAAGYDYHPTCKVHEGECRFVIQRECNLFLPKISVKCFGRKTANPE
ncbi:hypothetical protein FHETE_10913 [Fusarium heterosporum]|uniref:Uncharacterized protein n=1 Tax=Fusarium heterosporum TaxID=42747 RepID=A0A8H5SPG0_FUSHE|nr:hypothetical protein FHETE_10913 [Fusarium heterosporum]